MYANRDNCINSKHAYIKCEFQREFSHIVSRWPIFSYPELYFYFNVKRFKETYSKPQRKTVLYNILVRERCAFAFERSLPKPLNGKPYSFRPYDVLQVRKANRPDEIIFVEFNELNQ